ncbi:MAG: UvrD-helicase domain-containing protein [Elusimicrobiota bacterium]
MRIIITNDDISWAESILLPPREHFDEERQAVIRCLETKDILACPGSGKTTALLAKLLVLSRKLPLENNRGICVLTHTNVAINEIKSRAYFASQKLFNYPNHFGTIQSFVDKYLAIPAYINKFTRRPLFINNEIYFDRMERSRKYLGKNTNAFCYKSGQNKLPYSLKFEDFALDNNGICPKLKLDTNNTIEKGHYDRLKRLKEQILSDGILIYDDAYYLAEEYINKYPNLKNVFSKRFAYVFIDEMQDSSTTQSELLNMIFNDNVVVQKVGDLNQSIFDYNADLECGWKVNNDRTMFITGSKRFPSLIASKVENLCVRRQLITGNRRQNEITPVIIVYDDNTTQQVLDKFGELIIRNNLHQHEKKIFKAVGWVGKTNEKGKITIPSYWNGYSKEVKAKKTEFNNFKSYLTPQLDSFISSEGVNFYKKRITGALLKCLRIAGITDTGRAFTEKILYKQISENNPVFYKDFRVRLAKWCFQIHKQEDVFEEIKYYLTNEFREFFKYQLNDELAAFVNSSAMETENEEVFRGNNIYKYSSGTPEIEIEVSTIHGVKGETHTATCYLETFFYDYDIKRIIQYIKGEYSKPKGRVTQNLKMAFVGMSRPSHLLCVAVHLTNLTGQEEALRRSGWDVNNELAA